ncbi:MAG: DsbA family oxidoreductase [Polyangiaceae bacterium]|jgi:predicted DsbA family dithiol-disulfide isomerase
MTSLDVQVWSDIACPWCYVGKRRLEAAQAGFAHRDAVHVRWRAFELDPAAPRVRDATGPYAERLAKKYGMSKAQAEQRLRHLTEIAAAEGLDLRFDRIRPGNTFDAHRLIALARSRGFEDAAKERLMRAYFTDGLAIGDPSVLVALGEQVGLDGAEVHDALASDAYSEEVRADEELARDLGVSGVPFFVLGERLAVEGAQPSTTLTAALDQAWAEGPGAPRSEGPSCGPDGCDPALPA